MTHHSGLPTRGSWEPPRPVLRRLVRPLTARRQHTNVLSCLNEIWKEFAQCPAQETDPDSVPYVILPHFRPYSCYFAWSASNLQIILYYWSFNYVRVEQFLKSNQFSQLFSV